MLGKLISIRFYSMFAALGTSKKGRKSGTVAKLSPMRILGLGLLYTFVILVFAGMSFTYSMLMAPICVMYDAAWLFFSLLILLTFSVVFIFSVFETKSEIFDCKDNDLLLSLPIPAGKIVLARVLTVLIYNYLEAAVLMFPALLAFGLCGGGALGVVGGLLLWLVLPIGATALSSAVGYLVAVLSRRLKHKNLIVTALSLAFFFGYFWLLDSMESFMLGFEENFEGIVAGMGFFRFLGGAALLAPLPTLAVYAVCLGAGVLGYLVISRAFFSIVTDKRGAKKTVYRASRLEQRSAFYAVSKKEFFRFLSSPTYILNAGLGLIFTIVLAVAAVVNASDLHMLFAQIMDTGEGMPVPAGLVPALFFGALVLVNLFSTISCSALSLEGKGLWQMQCLPIPSRTVLLAKTIPHLVLTCTTSTLAGLLLAVAARGPWYWYPILILLPNLANTFCAFFGMCINVAFPKFDYVNEAQPVKQSLAMFICSFGQMLFGFALMAGVFIFSLLLSPLIVVLLVSILLLALSVLCFMLLVGPCVRKFEKM